MKNFKFLLALITCLYVFQAYAANAVAVPGAAVGTYYFQWDTIPSYGANKDTLTKADSSTILLLRPVKKGWDYFLEVGGVTGTGADSCSSFVRIDGYVTSANTGTASSFMRSVSVDSIVTTASGQGARNILLPINRTLFCDKFTIKYIQPASTGNEVIIGRVRLGRIRRENASVVDPNDSR